MHRIHRLTTLLAAIGLAAGVAACDQAQPFANEDLLAAAPNLSPDELIDDLQLEPGQEAEVREKLEELHESLTLLSEFHAETGDLATDEERHAYTEEMHAAMEDLHELHERFLSVLTEDQQERFVRHLHEQVEHRHHEVDADDAHDVRHMEGHGSDGS